MGSFRANWVKKSKQYSEEEIDSSRETAFQEDTTTKSSSKDYSFLFEKPSTIQEVLNQTEEDNENLISPPSKGYSTEERELLDRQFLSHKKSLEALVEEELEKIVDERRQTMKDIKPPIPEYDWNVGFTTTSGPTTTATSETVYIDLDSNIKQKYSITEEDLRKYSEMYNAFGKMAKQKSQKKSYTDYVLVLWPESESILSEPWFGDCILMNDKAHLGRIGSSAYFVPKELYETLNLTKNGKETTES